LGVVNSQDGEDGDGEEDIVEMVSLFFIRTHYHHGLIRFCLPKSGRKMFSPLAYTIGFALLGH